jgi:hypothetical protein
MSAIFPGLCQICGARGYGVSAAAGPGICPECDMK